MSKRNERWPEAAEIAYRAMGTDVIGKGRGREIIHRAHVDPLAWWCLTEWIYGYGQRMRREMPEKDNG